MSARIATGLAADDGGVDAFAEAASRAQLGLGGARPDLVMVFAGTPNLDHVEDGVEAVRDRLGADAALLGCGAPGGGGAGRGPGGGGGGGWAGAAPPGGGQGLPPERG